MAKGELLRHRDFRLLWGGETVSELGSQVSLLALPLLAVGPLHATALEMGLLTAASTAAFLVVGLPAGVWVDRMRRRRVMIGADVGRVVALGSIPIAYALGDLTLAQLFVVTLVSGLLTVFFDVAYQSYLPTLVGRAHLVEGNAKLTGSAAGGRGCRAERGWWPGPGHRKFRRGRNRLGELRRICRRRGRYPRTRAETRRARRWTSSPAAWNRGRSALRLRQRAPPCHCGNHRNRQSVQRDRRRRRDPLSGATGPRLARGDRLTLHHGRRRWRSRSLRRRADRAALRRGARHHPRHRRRAREPS